MEKENVRQIILDASKSDLGGFTLHSTKNAINLDFLSTADLRVEYYGGEIEVEALITGVCNLVQMPLETKHEVYDQIFQAYLSYVEELGYTSPHDAIKDQELKDHVPPTTSDDISDLVKFFSITGHSRPTDGAPVLSVRGDTAWESEHGIALFFENGERLVKIGNLND